MGQAIGESITFAVGVAISPVPIIAVILMLLSRQAGRNSLAFMLGWTIGIAGALTVVLLASGAIGTGTGGTPSHGTSTTKLVLGALVLLLARREWRRRPAPGAPSELPHWLQAVETVTPARSVGLGVALSVLNPKNLLFLVGGGLAIAGAPTGSGGKVIAGVVFVLLAISTVALPVLFYRLFGSRAERTLESLDGWLRTNNATVLSVLLLIIGVVLIGKGLGGF